MAHKILIIDDDPVSQNMQVFALSRAGYTVIAASSGEEGIQRAAKESPDLIILDIMMPEMDGMDVASFLKTNPKTEKIPIIFLSALIKKSGEKIKDKGNPTSYISKPYIKEDLLNEVKKYFLVKKPQ